MSDATNPRAAVRTEKKAGAAYAVAYVTGRLDSAGVVTVEPEITRAVQGNDRLVLDLAGVPYMSSMGLRLLITAARVLQKRGGRLVVANPTSDVEGVLAIAGLEKPLPVCASDAAVAKAFGL